MIKNVIVACDYAYYQGGAANVAMDTVVALAKYSNYNVYCFCGNGEPCKELKACGATVKDLRLPDLLGNKNKIDAFIKGIYNKNVERKFIETYESFNPSETIVHIHTYTKVLTSAVFRAANELGFKIFLTVHDYFLACPNGACFDYVQNKICERKPLSRSCVLCNCDARSYPQKLWRVLRQQKQNSVVRRIDNIEYIFISKYEEKQLIRRIPEIKRISFVQNPINSEAIKVDAEKNNIYAYIGRLSGEKGPALFCESVTKAKVKAMVLGDGVLRSELERKYPNIRFVGWVPKDKMRSYIEKMRVLVFPSLWYEGSPLTVPEMQSNGIPCIVTDCSSAIDTVIDGVNGIIVKPTVSALVQAIKKLQDDSLAERISESAYSTFDRKRLSRALYVESLCKIYER